MSQHLKYMPHVDGLRAVAVLSVLLFHLDVSWLRGGFVGVDIFFVISGFLITTLIKREIESTMTFDFKRFYIRRFWRLAPNILAVLAITSLVAMLLFSPMHLERYGESMVSAIFSVSNIFFFMNGGYFDSAAQLKPLLHTWSLSIEEQFYLIWPVLLLLLFEGGLKRWIPVLLIVMAGVSLYLNLIFSDGKTALTDEWFPQLHYLFDNGKSTIFFLLPFRIFEFAIGAVLVWAMPMRSKLQQVVLDALFWMGITALAACFIRYREWMLFPSYYAIVPCGAAAMVIFAGGHARGRGLLTNRVALWFGITSYSLYMVHWPLIVFTRYMQTNEQLSGSVALVLGVASIGLGWLLHKTIETPLRHGMSSRREQGTPKRSQFLLRAVPVFSVVLLTITGSGMSAGKGWPWRIDTSIGDEYIAAGSEFSEAYNGGAGYTRLGAIGDSTGVPDVIIMGDSHGRHYINGLYDIIAKPGGLNLYAAAHTSCLHLPRFTRRTAGMNYDEECPAGLDEALAYVERSRQAGNTPVVILSQFWLYQISLGDRLDDNGHREGRSITFEDIRRGITELKDLLGEADLVVIGHVPGTNNVNVMDELTRPLVGQKQKDLEVLFRTSLADGALLHQIDFNKEMRALANQTRSFTFLDPFDALCDGQYCQTVDKQSHPIYSDDNHLSKYGSRLVIENFAPVIRQIISENASTLLTTDT